MLSAQRLPKPDALTIEDGLGFRNVTAVAQDSRGLMWFGTLQGIERYDGQNFIKYGNDPQADFQFPGEDVFQESMLSINDSTLWMVANGQLYSLNIYTHASENLSAAAGLKGKIFSLRQGKNGTIWLVTDDDQQQVLYRQEAGLHFRQVATAKHLRMPFASVACDPNGNAWWSTNAEGLRLFSPDGELLHSVKPDSFIWFGTKMYFTPVFADSRNRVFIMPKSTYQIWQYHPENGSHDIIADSLSTPAYRNLEDSQGNVWFAMKDGLLRYSEDAGKKPTMTDFSGSVKNELQFLNIFDLYEDRTHVLWVATDNGLLRFPIGKQSFKNHLTVPGVAWGNSMRGMFQAKTGDVYAFCDNIKFGLYRLKPETGESRLEFPPEDSPTSTALEQSVKQFIFDKKSNEAWAISDYLLKINLNNGTTDVVAPFAGIANKFDHNPFYLLKDGSFLLGSKLETLTVYDPKTGIQNLLFPNGLHGAKPTNTEIFLEDTNGLIWVGTNSGGLFCFNRKGETLAHFSTKTKPALSKDHVLALHLDTAGKLWIGTFGGGLNCLELPLDRSQDPLGFKNLTGLSLRIFTQKEGLCDNNVVSILEDDEGNIWAATYNGISCYRVKEQEFRNFFEEDGLSNNEFNYTSALKDAQGRLWFGGMNGVNVFAPQDILQAEKNPPLCLTGISFYNQQQDKIETQVIGSPLVGRYLISPHVSWFQFNWALPNYFKPDKNHYHVWLEGLEAGWSYLGSTPFIRYNKLPPGDYILHVKGSDSKGNWSEAELAVPITVRPFFYQTIWFYLAVLVLVAGIAFAISRYRIQQLLEMERMRTRIASDLHDEVGSMLSGLAMQAELLEMTAPEKDRSRIEHIADISRTAVSKMRDLVWSIDSRRDKVKNLLDRMREQSADLLQPRDIGCRFELGELPLEKKLPVDIRQHIFLIFKEALNNVVRHSSASEVTVRFGNFDGQFELSIHDNGSCSPPMADDKVVTGLGLSNMEMRAGKLGAKLEVERSEGFMVRLRMKVF